MDKYCDKSLEEFNFQTLTAEKIQFFKYKVDNIRDNLKKDITLEDERKHLKTIRQIVQFCFWVGWIGLGVNNLLINIICIFLFSFSFTVNWTVLGHHTLHRGFDKLKDKKFHSTKFAKGILRIIHWPDWLHPPSWADEHNKLHHYFTNEIKDPDCVEVNNQFLRDLRIPNVVKYFFVVILMFMWKFTYYAHNIIMTRLHSEQEIVYIFSKKRNIYWQLLKKNIFYIIFHGYLFFILYLTILIPLPFLLFGFEYSKKALISAIIAEIISNIHTFIIIVPNHCGDDLYRFNSSVEANSAEFYLRGLLGSCNFKTGGNLNNLLHGYLNYQIEHHIYPNESALFYEKLQPQLKMLCRELNLPYIQESVWLRLYKTIQIIIGNTSMKVLQH
jgi:fatty acid desaturase